MRLNPINKLEDKRIVEPIAPTSKKSPVKRQDPRFDISLRDHINKLRGNKKETTAMVTRISARDRDDDEANLEDDYSDPDAIEDAAALAEERAAEKRKQALEDAAKGGKKPSSNVHVIEEEEEDTSALGAGAEALDIKDLQELALLKQQLAKEKKEQKRINLIRQTHIAWMRKNKPPEVFKDWLKANFPELYIVEFEENTPTESTQEVSEKSPYPIGTGYTPEEEAGLRKFWEVYESNRASEEQPQGASQEAEAPETSEAPEAGDDEDFEVAEVPSASDEDEDVLLSKEELEAEKKADKDVDFSSEAPEAQQEAKDKEEITIEEPKVEEKKKKKKKGKGEAYNKREVQIPAIEDLATFAYLPSTADEYDYDTNAIVDSFSEDDEYNLGQLRQKAKTIPKASPKIKEQIVDLIGKIYDYKLGEYVKTTRSKSGDKGAKAIEDEKRSEIDQISRLNDLEAQEIKFRLGEIQKHINRLQKGSSIPEAESEETEAEEKTPDEEK